MGSFKFIPILTALSLALAISSVTSVVLNVEGQPTELAKRAVPVPSNKAECSSYLASISHASTITNTKTLTRSSKATTTHITVTDQQGSTITLSPTTQKTITSTLTKYTGTSTGPVITSTTTIHGSGTTTITETALVASPTTVVSRRSLDSDKEKEEKNDFVQVYRRAQPYYDSPIVQKFLNSKKNKIITEACEDSLYGDGPIPTPIITSTKTVTKTVAKSTFTSTKHVTSTGDQTKTLPTSTITQTQTSTLSTISVAPGSATTITTSVGQKTITEKVPPTKITGHVIYNGSRMNDFTDEMGLHFTGSKTAGTEGTYVYDVATGHILDITEGSPTDAYLGAMPTFSPTWFGQDPQIVEGQPALISCSLESIINGPLNCALDGQSDTYYFGDCNNGQGAMMFAIQQMLNDSGCPAADLTFDTLTFT